MKEELEKRLFPNKLLILLVIISSLIPNYAKSEESKDTLKTTLPEIEVKSGRIISDEALKYSPIKIIDREEIKGLGAAQISDAVTFSPGVFIKNYGGLGGMKALSMRGTTSQQSLIMIDGIRLNSNQTGMLDLSTLPLALANDMEIIRGGASTIFGGNAIGGAVNIRTRKRFARPELETTFKYGSFNEKYFGANGGFSISTYSLSGIFEYTSSDGDYPFDVNHFGEDKTLSRENGDFENIALSLAANKYFGAWQTNFRTILRKSNRGAPGAVLQGNIESRGARLDEKEAMFFLSALNQFSDSSALNIGAFGKLNSMNFVDPDGIGTSGRGIDNEYDNVDYITNVRYSYSGSYINTDLGIEASYSRLNGDMLKRELEGAVDRFSYALSCRAESKEFLLLNENLSGIINAGIRYDDISDINSSLSPMLGIMAGSPFLPIKMRMQFSYNFRAPAFNEMYYINFGTNELKPEKSKSFNFGLSWEPFEFISFSGEAFAISTKDQIIAVPKSPVTWSAENKSEVFTYGIEGSAAIKLLEDKLYMNISYTMQSAKDADKSSVTYDKLIVYVPRELLAANAAYNFKSFRIGASLQYSSYRYALPDNSIESILPSYLIVNCNIRQELIILKTRIVLSLDIMNILDERYDVIKNYPMPGRSFRAGITVKY